VNLIELRYDISKVVSEWYLKEKRPLFGVGVRSSLKSGVDVGTFSNKYYSIRVSMQINHHFHPH
jgi:hypothetical protein